MRGLDTFRRGLYTEALGELESKLDLSPQELGLLGICEFKLNRLYDAELHLLRSYLLGEQEALLYYSRVLLLTDRPQQALKLMEEHFSELPRQLYLKALHIQADSLLQLGEIDKASEIAEKACNAQLQIGAEEDAGSILITVAKIESRLGNYSCAEKMLQISLSVLEELPDPWFRLQAFIELAHLYGAIGQLGHHLSVLSQAKKLACLTPSPIAETTVEWCSVRWQTEVKDDDFSLDNLIQKCIFLDDRHTLRSAILLKVERLVRQDRHAESLLLIKKFLNVNDPACHLMLGLIDLKNNDCESAILNTKSALERSERCCWRDLQLSATWQLAEAFDASDSPDLAKPLFKKAFEMVLETPYLQLAKNIIRDRWIVCRESDSLQVWADAWSLRIEPSGERVEVFIKTLGVQSAQIIGQPTILKTSIPLLVFLILHPGHTRRELELALYPDRSPVAATSAVKFDIHELRSYFGKDAIISKGGYHSQKYELTTKYRFRLDLDDLKMALKNNNLSSALDQYIGDFLPNHQECDWSSEIRRQLHDNLRLIVVEKLKQYFEKHRWERVKQLAVKYLKSNPGDREVANIAIESSRRLGDPLGLVQKYFNC